MLEGVSPSFTYYAGSSASGTGSTTVPTTRRHWTVVASFPGSAEYTAVQNSPVTFTINKAMPTLTLSEYRRDLQRLGLRCRISGHSGVVSSVDTTPAGSLEAASPHTLLLCRQHRQWQRHRHSADDARTYTVVATFPGSAHYIVVENGPLTFTINKATPTLTPSYGGRTFNGSAFAATALVSGVVNGVDTTPAGNLEGVPPTITTMPAAPLAESVRLHAHQRRQLPGRRDFPR